MIWMGPDDDPPQERPAQAGPSSGFLNGTPPRYAQRGTGMVHQQRLQNGHFKVTSLANFQARIVRDLVFDDGEQEKREFGIEAKLADSTLDFSVSAEEFGRMGWVLSRLGRKRSSTLVSTSMPALPYSRYPAPFARNASSLTWAGGRRVPSGSTFMLAAPLDRADRFPRCRCDCQPLCRLIKSGSRRILMNAYEQSVIACVSCRSRLTGSRSRFWLAYTEPRLETRGLASFS
jgi:hypothetical protein